MGWYNFYTDSTDFKEVLSIIRTAMSKGGSTKRTDPHYRCWGIRFTDSLDNLHGAHPWLEDDDMRREIFNKIIAYIQHQSIQKEEYQALLRFLNNRKFLIN